MLEAAPFSADGGPHGALVIHGITGTPGSVMGVARSLVGAGFTVEVPLLPGHGTVVDDLIDTGWDDWAGAVEDAYRSLAGRCARVVVFGLSMGGTLATWLAAQQPDVAGLVCVNPMIEPVAPSFVEILEGLLAAGVTIVPGEAVDADFSRPGGREPGYGCMPVGPLLSLVVDGVARLEPRLDTIRCPVLLFTSVRDRVVPPVSSDRLAARVAGPVERVLLEESLHVATLDVDAERIEAATTAFARAVTAGAGTDLPNSDTPLGRRA